VIGRADHPFPISTHILTYPPTHLRSSGWRPLHRWRYVTCFSVSATSAWRHT